MQTIIPDTCVKYIKDVYDASCDFKPSLMQGAYVSFENLTLDLSSLDQSTIRDLIAARKLYVLKGFRGAPEANITSLETGTTGYGYTEIINPATNGDVTINYPFSQCIFRQLQSWTGVACYVFPVGQDNKIGGILSTDGTTLSGQPSFFAVSKSLPFKFTNEIVVSPLKWIFDNARINHYAELAYEFNNLDGVVPVLATASNEATTGFDLELLTGCNGAPAAGLDGDIVVLDNAGSPVSTTITYANGVYSISGTFTSSETYSANLSSDVVAVGNRLYGALGTDLAVTIP